MSLEEQKEEVKKDMPTETENGQENVQQNIEKHNPEVKIEEKDVNPVEKPEKDPVSDKISGFLKKNWFWILIVALLIAIVIFGTNMRTQNLENLKDVTTGKYTLGPDLDPFLYLRLAKDISSGTLKNPDMMVKAPLGDPSYAYKSLMPWAIVVVYKIIDFFIDGPKATIEYAANISPVIFTALATIVFFIFIYVIFSIKMSKKNSALIAIIATIFYSVMPEMIHRTTGGIPEIESLGMLWFWLSFLFFTLAWKSDKLKKQALFGLIAGLFTALMIYTWGGSIYIFMSFGLMSLLFFLFNKEKKKNMLILISWLILPLIAFDLRNHSFFAVFQSISNTGFCIGVFLLLVLDAIIFNTKLKKIKEKIRLPESVITILIAIILGLLVLLVLNPGMIASTASGIISRLIHPFGEGRTGLTVAENHAPYFTEVLGSFSWVFWGFLVGILLFFIDAIKEFDKKKKMWLIAGFIVFLIALLFTRISPSSLLNGENTISDSLYFLGIIFFFLVIAGLYIEAFVKNDEKTLNDFKELDFSHILLIVFSFWMIISMRGAIRLFFIISPAMIIFSSYLPAKISEYALKTKEKAYKVLIFCIVLLVAILLIITLVNFEKSSNFQAKYTVNGPYYEQWQKAMAWIRTDTPEDSIFVSWWDYGYWIQTLGERPTVTDGGHLYNYWDHTTARYLMTAKDEKTALQLCKAHNVSYFLIDSTDIGKYSAFASIGSDKTGQDRLSWISTFLMSDSQTQETKNETIYVYAGGSMLDQDIQWKGNFFPSGKAGIGAFLLTISKETQQISGVTGIMVYKNQQYYVPIKYLWINGITYKFDAPDAIDSMLYLLPSIDQTGLKNLGAGLYLSEKALNTEWVRLYLLNESDNFKLAHNEPSPFVKQLKDNYNLSVGDLVYSNGIQGPIKIWKVNYPENITYYKEYLEQGIDLDGQQAFGKLDYLGV